MDIFNIQSLVAQGLITNIVSIDPNNAYITVGVYQPGNRPSGSGNNTYPSYAIRVSEFLATGAVYTASNGIALVGNDFRLASNLISQFTNDVGYLTSSATTDLDPVISQTNVVPGAPTLGDRYLAGTTPGAPWTANSIEEWDGAVWVTTAPALDDVVFITSTLSTLRYNGSAWVAYAGTAVLNQGNTTGSTLVIGTNTAQALAFKTNNVETARVVSGGSWGFGTPIPSAKVSIKGQGATSATMAFDVRNSSNTLMLAVRNDGNVGIGETSPLARLAVLTEDNLSTSYGVKIRQNVTGDDLFYIKGNGDSAFTSKARLSIGDLPSATSRLNIQGQNGAAASDNILISYNYGASLIALIVKESTNVGIGKQNQTPTARLHVEGIDATSSNYSLKIDNSASSPLLYVRNDGVDAAYFHSTGRIYMGTSTIGKSSASNGIAISALGQADWAFGFNNGELRTNGVYESGVFMNVTCTNSTTTLTSLMNSASKRWDYGIVSNDFKIRGVLNADPGTTDVLIFNQVTGNTSMPKLATSNVGLTTGDMYVDTAANILANGDKVVGWKV